MRGMEEAITCFNLFVLNLDRLFLVFTTPSSNQNALKNSFTYFMTVELIKVEDILSKHSLKLFNISHSHGG